MNFLKNILIIFKFEKEDATYNILSQKNYYGNENYLQEIKKDPFEDTYDKNYLKENCENKLIFLDPFPEYLYEYLPSSKFKRNSYKLTVKLLNKETSDLELQLEHINFIFKVESNYYTKLTILKNFMKLKNKFYREDLITTSGLTIKDIYKNMLKNFRLEIL